MTSFIKSLVAVGMILFFTLGAFAVSYAAHDVPSGWPLPTFEIRIPLKSGSALMDWNTVALGMDFGTGDVPKSPRLDLPEHRSFCSHIAAPANPFFPTAGHVANVSLQILKSVLLL